MPGHRDRKLLRAIATYQRHRDKPGLVAALRRFQGKLVHLVLSHLSGSDIHRDARIDPSVRFPHLNGVVVHQQAVVGRDCLIMQQVTLGQLARGGAPVLEDGVYVGAGAKVLGGVRIGTGARVGANAVVLTDVAPHSTVVGIPARQVRARTPDEPAGEADLPADLADLLNAAVLDEMPADFAARRAAERAALTRVPAEVVPADAAPEAAPKRS